MATQGMYEQTMGNRRQGKYPMTQKIRKQMMPNTPGAPNGRPVGQADTVQRQPRQMGAQKGSLTSRVDKIMARNPGFDRANVEGRVAGREGVEMGGEGFDMNQAFKSRNQMAGIAEQMQPGAGAGVMGKDVSELGGLRDQMSQIGGGNFQNRPGMTGNIEQGIPGQQVPGQAPGGFFDQRTGMAQPGQLQPQVQGQLPPGQGQPQDPRRRRPNAEWYRGGERY